MSSLLSVVIATRDRPELLRRAVDAVLAQDHGGPIECLVVFDQSEPTAVASWSTGPDRTVRALSNDRTPGLAGARNTGILAARGDLVAFCDDDDEWLPTKVRQQVRLLERHPEAAVVATGVTIVTKDDRHERLPPERTTFEDFLRSRVTEIHPSTLVLRRSDLLGAIGLVDEALPSSYGEDYELLLRATRTGPVVSVRKPLVRVYWNRPSFFSSRWDSISAGLTYLLATVPEFARQPRGLARVEGQIAFAHAAGRRRRESLRWSARALRHDPRQLRAFAALAVSSGLVDAERLVVAVQARGRGL